MTTNEKTCFECRLGEHDNYGPAIGRFSYTCPSSGKRRINAYLCEEHYAMLADEVELCNIPEVKEQSGIQNLNQLRNNYSGLTFTMIRHDWFRNNKLMNVPRKIIKVCGNRITFEGGSSLTLTTARDIKFSENELIVSLKGKGDFSQVLVYRIEHN